MSEEQLPSIDDSSGSVKAGPKYSPIPFVIVALVLVFILYQGLGGAATYLLFGGQITPETVAGIRWATMLSQLLFLLVPTLVMLKVQHGSALGAIPLRIPKAAEFLLVVLCVVSLQQALEGYLYLQDMIPLPAGVQHVVEMMKRMIEETIRLLGESHSPQELLFVVTVVAVTPALCEELFFRGLIQNNLMLASNTRTGIIATGLIFGLYHLNPFLLVPLAVLGIFFSYVRVRSNTLILPIVAHFVNNAVSAAGFFWQQERTSSSFLLEGAADNVPLQYVIGVTAVSAVVFAICLVSYRIVTQQLSTVSIDD
ncbi:MAG TPA: CPBP family intramembrane glutamic endopeptidase [Bacteroidota bacterium]|nr:CPBP family intramembrane glutamic endopeptidase [Bacteroidota bacterium]